MRKKHLINLVASILLVQNLAQPTYACNDGGEEIFLENCSICHGQKGEGTVMGKALLTIEMKEKSKEQIFEIVKNGRNGTAMRKYDGILQEDEIGRVVQYILEHIL